MKNNNTVELLGYYGGDQSHAISAWCSTNRDLTPEKIERIPKLLEFLVAGSDGNIHSSPFEKSALHFLVRSSYVEHIHIIKHRIGVSVNGESARYKELKDDESYIPTDWPSEWKEKLINHRNASFKLYHDCLDSLVNKYGYNKSRAKESARYFNLTSTQINQDVQFNFLSFAKFCKLRAVPSAQREIRQIALEMLQLVHNIPGNPFEHSLRVWGLTDLYINSGTMTLSDEDVYQTPDPTEEVLFPEAFQEWTTTVLPPQKSTLIEFSPNDSWSWNRIEINDIPTGRTIVVNDIDSTQSPFSLTDYGKKFK